MDSLPSALYTAEQARELDRLAIAAGIDGYRLMYRAGQAAFAALMAQSRVKRLTVLAGKGNNGGDGFVIAGLAASQGIEVQLRVVAEQGWQQCLSADALTALHWAREQGISEQLFDPDEPLLGDWLVDAMLGIGLQGEVRGLFRLAIDKLNRARQPILAIDIPSGLCADSGQILGTAVQASLTVTFIGLKQGLLMQQGPEVCGQLLFDSLRVPDRVYESVPVSLFRTCMDDLRQGVAKRPRHAHKGMYGHLLVVGGDIGMGGAVMLAAEAALRSGAGKVTVATRAEHVGALLARCPEMMCRAVVSGAELAPLVTAADALVVGPGLGQGAWAEQLLQQVRQTAKPTLIDADGLNMLVIKDWLEATPANWLLTPHPGEAARMIGCGTAKVQKNRLAALAALTELGEATVVLKGASSLVASGSDIHLCSAGNPGMAVAGWAMCFLVLSAPYWPRG